MTKKNVQLEGAEELRKLFDQFPNTVKKRASKQGLGKAGAKLRTMVRRDAPRVSGNLRRALRVKRHRNGSVTVGLKERFYYKVLDLKTKRGEPLHPWFLSSVERHSPAIANLIVTETKLVLYNEAGKAYSRNKSSLRRR